MNLGLGQPALLAPQVLAELRPACAKTKNQTYIRARGIVVSSVDVADFVDDLYD